MRLLQPEHLPFVPAGKMTRIITHWTAGGYTASPIDKEHYHLLIEGDGRIIFGDHSITDNVSTADDNYAAHTRNLNTGSIGIAVCAMMDAIESPFDPGPYPMKKSQYEILIKATAELCEKYNITPSQQHVMAHGEVEQITGVKQNGKWDPMVLPWQQDMPQHKVGSAFRDGVKAHLITLSGEQETGFVLTPWKETAYEFVVKNGISDGSRPADPAARVEVWSMLQRFAEVFNLKES